MQAACLSLLTLPNFTQGEYIQVTLHSTHGITCPLPGAE
jgi:hypothetical protein